MRITAQEIKSCCKGCEENKTNEDDKLISTDYVHTHVVNVMGFIFDGCHSEVWLGTGFAPGRAHLYLSNKHHTVPSLVLATARNTSAP